MMPRPSWFILGESGCIILPVRRSQTAESLLVWEEFPANDKTLTKMTDSFTQFFILSSRSVFETFSAL